MLLLPRLPLFILSFLSPLPAAFSPGPHSLLQISHSCLSLSSLNYLRSPLQFQRVSFILPSFLLFYDSSAFLYPGLCYLGVRTSSSSGLSSFTLSCINFMITITSHSRDFLPLRIHSSSPLSISCVSQQPDSSQVRFSALSS